jgi:hypothetical protein
VRDRSVNKIGKSVIRVWIILRLLVLFLVTFKEIKCALVQALRLCTGLTTHRGSRSIALLFHDHSTRMGWGISITLWLLFTPGKDPVPIVQKAGWAPGPVWTGAENLTPPGFDSWTVQSVASRYTEYATQPSSTYWVIISIRPQSLPCRHFQIYHSF